MPNKIAHFKQLVGEDSCHDFKRNWALFVIHLKCQLDQKLKCVSSYEKTFWNLTSINVPKNPQTEYIHPKNK